MVIDVRGINGISMGRWVDGDGLGGGGDDDVGWVGSIKGLRDDSDGVTSFRVIIHHGSVSEGD